MNTVFINKILDKVIQFIDFNLCFCDMLDTPLSRSSFLFGKNFAEIVINLSCL